MQSVAITTDVVSSNLDQGEVYNIMYFSLDPPVSSTNKTDRHDITEILLKVALSTIKQTNKHNHATGTFLYFFDLSAPVLAFLEALYLGNRTRFTFLL